MLEDVTLKHFIKISNGSKSFRETFFCTKGSAMNVLIVEDSTQEQQRAIKAVLEVFFPSGKERQNTSRRDGTDITLYPTEDGAIWVVSSMMQALSFLRVADAVLTDLHFPLNENGYGSELPNGISVLARSIKWGVPVGLCTDTNHHQTHYLQDLALVLGEFPVSNDKDWTWVAKKLKK